MLAGSDYKRMPVRCEINDPHACDHCHEFLAIPGSRFCPIHCSDSEITSVREGLYRFKRTEALGRLQGMKSHSESRSLANELALLRVLLETLVNNCEDSYDLLTNEASISNLISKIQMTLVANQKVEERCGELLSLAQVIEMFQAFFSIIAGPNGYIKDPDVQQEIADRLNALIYGDSRPADPRDTPAYLPPAAAVPDDSDPDDIDPYADPSDYDE